MTKPSVLLVIDASVAQAAGTKGAPESGSPQCRYFLRQVLSICHRIAFSSEMFNEWKRHESAFSRTWRVEMVSRKKMRPLGAVAHGLADAIDKLHCEEHERRAMLKDCHVAEAAMLADGIAVTLDRRCRGPFTTYATPLGIVEKVRWVSPTKPAETEFLGITPPDE